VLPSTDEHRLPARTPGDAPSVRHPGRRVPVMSRADTFAGLPAVSLAELDERAALLKRVDVKYVVTPDQLDGLIDALRDDHDVLEIDGLRRFPYETVYFDTAELRSFCEHAAGAAPRFKARTRCYVAAGDCVFEVKVKTVEGETDKHQREHAAAADELDAADLEHLTSTLEAAGIEPPARLETVLRTRFERATLAHREGSARATIDFGVTLERPDGEAVRIRDGLILVESKSEDGNAPADRALRELDARVVSLSKYRTGIDALVRRDATGELDGIRELFASVS
jgi:VTC domain